MRGEWTIAVERFPVVTKRKDALTNDYIGKHHTLIHQTRLFHPGAFDFSQSCTNREHRWA